MVYRPKEVAQRLGIAPSTLRLWSVQFAESLSGPARKEGLGGVGSAQRRYSDEDLSRLLEIKALLGEGLTYGEARRRLARPRRESPVQPGAGGIGKPAAVDVDGEIRSALTVLEEALAAKEKTIAALEEALRAKERAVAALTEALAAKEKTIAALKDSVEFLDVYLRAVREERDNVRDKASQIVRELERMEQEALQEQGIDDQLEKPWWKRLLT